MSEDERMSNVSEGAVNAGEDDVAAVLAADPDDGGLFDLLLEEGA